MSKVLIEEQTLHDIGDAIRARNGLDTTYKPSEMAGCITEMRTSYNTPINQNGNFLDPIPKYGDYLDTKYSELITNGHTYNQNEEFLEGWYIQYAGTLKLTSNGLEIYNDESEDHENLYSQYYFGDDVLNNKTLTLTAIIDGIRYTSTFVYKDGMNSEVDGNRVGDGSGVYVGCLRDFSTQMAIYIWVTNDSQHTHHTISAIQLEFGDKSTLGNTDVYIDKSFAYQLASRLCK